MWKERNWLPGWSYPRGMFLHAGKGWSGPTASFHPTAEPWVSPVHLGYCRGCWETVLHLQPVSTGHAVQGSWLVELTSFPESSHTISPPNHLSKKYSIPSRRSHPATFQDAVFLSSQSKGLGKIDGLQCNKYFLLQNSPGQRGYRSTRIEMEVVNHFSSILVLGEQMLKLR